MRPTHDTSRPPAQAPVTTAPHDAGSAAHHSNAEDLDAYIEELISHAPPLSSEQRDKLALLLNSHCRTR